MSKINPKISIVIPIHWMKKWDFFLQRCLKSIEEQTFTDYEIIITMAGKMAENTNRGISSARGELIKILYLDDWLDSSDYLMEVYTAFLNSEVEWLITSATNNKYPAWTNDIEGGNNKLGSPSALTFRNKFENNLLFDENLSWLLDCDLYKRMEKKLGKPSILTRVGVGIGIHDGQMSNILTNEEKGLEYKYTKEKYA